MTKVTRVTACATQKDSGTIYFDTATYLNLFESIRDHHAASGKLLRQAWTIDKPLTIAGASFAAVLLVAAVGIVVDPTVITGAPAFVVILAWIANLILGVLLLRQRLADRALAWSLRLGAYSFRR